MASGRGVQAGRRHGGIRQYDLGPVMNCKVDVFAANPEHSDVIWQAAFFFPGWI